MRYTLCLACISFLTITAGALVLLDKVMLPPKESLNEASSDKTDQTYEPFFYRTLGRHPAPTSAQQDQAPITPSDNRFTLEIARVGSQAAAESWLDRLNQAGIHAFYTPVNTGNKVIFKVRSGLFKSEKMAELARTRLQQQHQLNAGIINL